MRTPSVRAVIRGDRTIMPHRAAVIVFLLLIVPAAVPLAGCRSKGPLSFGGSSGRYVGEESLRRIKPGETDREWLLAVFGRPHERELLAGGVEEIWKYQYELVEGRGSRSMLVNNRTTKGATARYLYIQLSGNIVKDSWRD